MSARIVHVCTVPLSLSFLRGTLTHLNRLGYEVHVVTSPGALLDDFERSTGITSHRVAMTRAITPTEDARSLAELVRLFRRLKPDLVHAHTPKGGLLGMLAATITRVPNRIYHLRGLRFATAVGKRRSLLKATERLTSSLAHTTICVSHSMMQEAVAEHVIEPSRARVLGHGSGQGVDASSKFAPSSGRKRGIAFRRQHGIPEDAVVIGFVGRFTRDKGMRELADSWHSLRAKYANVRLLLIGEGDDSDPVDLRDLLADERVCAPGFLSDTRSAYEAMDIMALPTYREGFPNVALESAAMQVPVVASRVTGCVDAVVDGQTGLLVSPRDATSLGLALQALIEDEPRRHQLGGAARERVLSHFRPEYICEATAELYGTLLHK